jgi:hypothetical protein
MFAEANADKPRAAGDGPGFSRVLGARPLAAGVSGDGVIRQRKPTACRPSPNEGQPEGQRRHILLYFGLFKRLRAIRTRTVM